MKPLVCLLVSSNLLICALSHQRMVATLSCVFMVFFSGVVWRAELGHRIWATVTWPANELRDNVWVLNQSADVGASFIFAYNPAEWGAVWPNVFLEEGVGITLTPQGCFDLLPMAALQASTKLTT